MHYKDFFNHVEYSEEAEKLIKTYLTESPAYRVKAEPNWRLLTIVPKADDSYDVEVDIIHIDEWIYFTSLRFLELTKDNLLKRSLINTQMEQSIPVIPDSYQGKLRPFFDSIRRDFPNWNGATFPSLMIGCISPSDNFSDEYLKTRAKEVWKKSRESIKSGEEAINKFYEALGKGSGVKSKDSTFKSLMDQLTGSLGTDDKSKLN